MSSMLFNGLFLGIIPAIACLQFVRLDKAEKQLQPLISENRGVPLTQKAEANRKIVLEGENETLTLKLKDIILIAAEDNYVKVYWYQNKIVHQRLIRATLKSMEIQLDFPTVLRCHRSYIVNLQKVDAVVGKTKQYKLKIQYLERAIPVSRKLQSSALRRMIEQSRQS